MNAAELGEYLQEHIPLSRALGIAVVQAGPDEVRLCAPLLPGNINHQSTVFGGSACAVAILAAWSLVHVRLQAAGLHAPVVIQSNSLDYRLPMQGDFEARGFLTDPTAWTRFATTLQRRGRARLTVSAELRCAGMLCGTFEGAFVAAKT